MKLPLWREILTMDTLFPYLSSLLWVTLSIVLGTTVGLVEKPQMCMSMTTLVWVDGVGLGVYGG